MRNKAISTTDQPLLPGFEPLPSPHTVRERTTRITAAQFASRPKQEICNNDLERPDAFSDLGYQKRLKRR